MIKSSKGTLLIIDGPNGAGKTTVCELLQKAIENSIYLREPGSLEQCEAIRKVIFHYKADLDLTTQYHLFQAARHELFIKAIFPALDEGKTVILDRSVLSTIVYQKSFKKPIEEFNALLSMYDKPFNCMMYFIYAPYNILLDRIKQRNLTNHPFEEGLAETSSNYIKAYKLLSVGNFLKFPIKSIVNKQSSNTVKRIIRITNTEFGGDLIERRN